MQPASAPAARPLERVLNTVEEPQQDPIVHRTFQAVLAGQLDADAAIATIEARVGVVPTEAQRRLRDIEQGSQVPFSHFLRAFNHPIAPGLPGKMAGAPVRIEDQAARIIADNSGPAQAPVKKDVSGRKKSDIGQMGEVNYMMADATSARVRKSNGLSAANTLAIQHDFEPANRALGLANEATRLFIGNEIKAGEFHRILAQLGVENVPPPLEKAIVDHQRTGAGSFKDMSRLVKPIILEVDAMRTIDPNTLKHA
jgi:hypothetical protein